ncbi:WD repeat-containing protein 79 [Moelleriella libera RCEF 2490]|uniref:WD repeat-containing protein 79 n=1 Tax=Moelleriella libera RCEF 2490 TaxID=1081109 RepID=A0A166UF41_9HYPO|nr:WD repeat-containing protein 79 [Moelleriella libera RCEF 2490]
MNQEPDDSDQNVPRWPKTGLVAQTSAHQAADRTSPQAPGPPRFFSSAQWTADGTTILTGGSDNSVSTFVIPSDLLQPHNQTPTIEAQAVVRLPEPSQVLLPAPFFSLTEPASQAFLVGCRDHPLHLYHAFPEQGEAGPIGQYKLVRHETEQYITPSSLEWQHPGTHFVCGSANRLDYFDVSRPGFEGPVLTVPTIPSKRHISKGHGIGMKGTVSALAISPPDANGGSLLAAGTWTRWMGLYDLHRSDGAVANWKISQSDMPGSADRSIGQGIIQVLWSSCGRYLVVNERHADGLLVYDIRGSGKLLSVLSGRKSSTQQKLLCDTFPGDSSGGFEVWAGGQDGSVTVWEHVGMTAAEVGPSWAWKAHDAPVCSSILHRSGSVAATCSGGWRHAVAYDDHDHDHDNDNLDAPPARQAQSYEVFPESTLKLWSVTGGEDEEERALS